MAHVRQQIRDRIASVLTSNVALVSARCDRLHGRRGVGLADVGRQDDDARRADQRRHLREGDGEFR